MNPYAIIGGLLVAIALFFGGTRVGAKMERSEWQAKEIVTAKAVAKARDFWMNKAEDERRAYAEQKRKDDDAHQTELILVKARRVADVGKRVPVSAGFCTPSAPRPASSAGGVIETAPATQFLPDAFAGDLRQLAADADEVVADLRYLVVQAKNAGCFMGYDAPPSLGENHELVRHPEPTENESPLQRDDGSDSAGYLVPGGDPGT